MGEDKVQPANGIVHQMIMSVKVGLVEKCREGKKKEMKREEGDKERSYSLSSGLCSSSPREAL